jgi:hypothetical protein
MENSIQKLNNGLFLTLLLFSIQTSSVSVNQISPTPHLSMNNYNAQQNLSGPTAGLSTRPALKIPISHALITDSKEALSRLLMAVTVADYLHILQIHLGVGLRKSSASLNTAQLL